MDTQLTTCTQCGALLPPEAAYCQQCGQSTAPAAPVSAPGWPAAPYHAAPPAAPYPARSKMDPTLRTVLIVVGATCGCLLLVVVIGIIASVALPAILSQRQSGKRELAQNALRAVVSAQFAYYANYGQYAGSLEELAPDYLDPALAEPAPDLAVSVTSAGQSFSATITSTDPPFTYTADESGQINGP